MNPFLDPLNPMSPLSPANPSNPASPFNPVNTATAAAAQGTPSRAPDGGEYIVAGVLVALVIGIVLMLRGAFR